MDAWVHCPKPTEGRFEQMRVRVEGASSYVDENATETVHHVGARFRCCNYDATDEVCGEPLVVFLPEPAGALVAGLVLVALLARWRRR